ncbi:MAG TPA: hypothetical protein VF306_22945 [Pirellulales bacterium]
MIEESDTYLMILERGEERGAKASILAFGEEKFGTADEGIKARLRDIADLERLKRMARRAANALSWQEILDTP